MAGGGMSAALLHVGAVTHRRFTPFRHGFGYRMWMLSVDLHDLPASRLFGHNRRGLLALYDRDHGPRDGTGLRPWVAEMLDGAGLGAFSASIRFMFIPRVAGFAFNPIAFFFCHDAAGRLGAVIHQVKNTFGGQTAYVLPVEAGTAPIRQSAQKRLHVSPFFDMAGGYRFAFSPPDFVKPGGDFTMTIRYGTRGAVRMTATMRLRARPFTTATVLRLVAAMPLMPLKVVAAIHWQALRLWLKGARYHPVPEPSKQALEVRA